MDSYAILEKLCNIPGAIGFEDQVRETIAELVRPLVDDLRVDALGNLIVTRRGKSNFKLMLDAHMDEIGFMVQYIDERGFIRFTPLGSWDARLLLSHAPTIYTREGGSVQGVIGTRPPHILLPAERESVIPVEDMFIDVGATSRQEVREMGVRVGDPILIAYPFCRIGKDTVMGKALDDRVGCAMILKTLEMHGFLRYAQQEGGVYRLSFRLVELGGIAYKTTSMRKQGVRSRLSSRIRRSAKP